MASNTAAQMMRKDRLRREGSSMPSEASVSDDTRRTREPLVRSSTLSAAA